MHHVCLTDFYDLFLGKLRLPWLSRLSGKRDEFLFCLTKEISRA